MFLSLKTRDVSSLSSFWWSLIVSIPCLSQVCKDVSLGYSGNSARMLVWDTWTNFLLSLLVWPLIACYRHICTPAQMVTVNPISVSLPLASHFNPVTYMFPVEKKKKKDFPWGYPERMLEKAMTWQPLEQKSKMSPFWYSQDSCRRRGAGQPALTVQSHNYLTASSWDRGAEDPHASAWALSAITCSLSPGWQHHAWTGGLEAHRGAWLWNNINLKSNSEQLSSGHTFLLRAWFFICCFNFVCLFVFLSSKVL